MKLIVTGHGRHGKDTACEYLQQHYNLTYESSSFYCAKRFIADKLGYNTVEEAYEDRHNHRADWYNLIHEYCENDYSRLGREILGEYDVYCGLRNNKELQAIQRKGLVDLVVWVDRSKKVPPESSTSISITPSMCDVIVDNNRDLPYLYQQLDKLIVQHGSST